MSAASGSQPLSEEKKHEFKPVEEVEGMDSSEEWKLNPEDIVNRCHVCQATENLMRCSACKAVYYCSKQHQRQDWPAHKPLCKQLQIEEEVMKMPQKLPPKGDDDNTPGIPEKGQDGAVGLCGIHLLTDLSGYVHALNNMAGSMRIDMPLSAFENFEMEDAKFQKLESNLTLPNGLVLLRGGEKRRTLSPIGFGILFNGTMKVGTILESSKADEVGKEVEAEWDGNKERKCYITTKTKIGDHIVALPSSYITAYCAIYGPLLYRGIEFGRTGGVHYNGCAFLHDGRQEEGKVKSPYQEACIEKMVQSKSPS